MTFSIFIYIGGALTVFSLCVLLKLSLIFAQTQYSYNKQNGGLPLLLIFACMLVSSMTILIIGIKGDKNLNDIPDINYINSVNNIDDINISNNNIISMNNISKVNYLAATKQLINNPYTKKTDFLLKSTTNELVINNAVINKSHLATKLILMPAQTTALIYIKPSKSADLIMATRSGRSINFSGILELKNASNVLTAKKPVKVTNFASSKMVLAGLRSEIPQERIK